MTREDIEKNGRINRETVLKELQEGYQKHKDINHYNIASATIEKYGLPLFKAGANWRINSAWHNISEEPEILGVFIILHNSYGYTALVVPINSDEWIRYKRTFKPDEWAYMQDLLPNKED